MSTKKSTLLYAILQIAKLKQMCIHGHWSLAETLISHPTSVILTVFHPASNRLLEMLDKGAVKTQAGLVSTLFIPDNS